MEESFQGNLRAPTKTHKLLLRLNKFRPVGNFLLLSLPEPEKKTASGIIIPEQAQDSGNQGVIVHRGGTVPVEFNIGDTVLFQPNSDNKVKLDGVLYTLLDYQNVMLIERGDIPVAGLN